ncbi:MAG: DNRLRE domain-containing protein [Planctomycetota bacterium]
MLQTPALLIGALSATIVGASAQTTVAILCDRDNTLYEDPIGALSNGAGASLFVGKTGTNLIRRALVHFDVAGSVPPGARVLSATLSFRIPSLTSGQTASAHRVLQDWGEGTSVAAGNGGGGASATANDATWLHRFYPGSPWASAGGDYDPAQSLSMPLWLGLNVSTPAPGAAADAQFWLDNPGQNFGWLLRNSELAAATANRIDSRESGSIALPMMSVTYLVPGTGGFWGLGCPMPFGYYQFQFGGAPIGGSTIAMQQSNGPANAISALFFALALDAAGTTLAPGCSAYLPFAGMISGPTVLLDNAGSASTPFAVPAGFPGYVVVCQAAALGASPLGFTLSNAGVLCLQ